MNDRKLVVFTDLDGTLLDAETYSFDEALPALSVLKERGVPLVICSSKTRNEILHYRRKLNNSHPFVSENGGGVFIPSGYFRLGIEAGVETVDGFHVVRLGARYSELREAIGRLRDEGFAIKGFGDMTAGEIAEAAGMDIEEAEMAKERDFDEPFLLEGGGGVEKLRDSIRAKGFRFTSGRFLHIVGESDKGRAVSILMELYEKNFGKIKTVALGDNPNDVEMLKRVDCPVVVQKPGGAYDAIISANVARLMKAKGVGPRGWNSAVIGLLSGTERPAA